MAFEPAAAPSLDDLKSAGYTLFSEKAAVGLHVMDVWQQHSRKGEGWQYLVSLEVPSQGLLVLNADAPEHAVSNVATLANLLMQAKMVPARPDLAFEWAFCINESNDFSGNFCAESIRDRALAETILYGELDDTDRITTFTIECDGQQNANDEENWRSVSWLEMQAEQLCIHPLGQLNFAIVNNHLESVLIAMEEGDAPSLHAGQVVRSPLHFCALMGRKEMVPALVDAGHDPNGFDAHGNAPMHVAATNGDEAMCVELYKNGADPLKTNDSGLDALAIGRALGLPGEFFQLRTVVASIVARDALKEMLVPQSDGPSRSTRF